MLKSLTNSAVSKNHLSIWLLVLLSALFQLPVSASSSEFISHERVELVESSTFNQVELVHILAGSFIRQVDRNLPIVSNIQDYHNRQTVKAEEVAEFIRAEIASKELLKLLPAPTNYDDETNRSYSIG
ncbi:MAG: hypothetical protein CMP48_13720 [Rickettsiales bacterium]|nr:hypothetical protein [Rickettsiales bacterium]